MTVSIIIVSYNTRQCLKNCLNSIREKVIEITYEIIVVDNDSQDGSQEMLRKDFPDVTLIRSENKGFGTANNRGVRKAQGRNILFLNPDTLLINNAVKIMSDYLDTHPEVGICGGNLYRADGTTPANSCWNYFTGISHAINMITMTLASRIIHPQTHKYNHSNYPKPVACVSGAGLMTRQILFDQIGGFDEDFFMYVEDVDICYRINKAGYSVICHPAAKIIHLEGQSSKANTNHISPYEAISHRLFLRKRYPQKWKRFLCKSLCVVGYFNMMLAAICSGRRVLIHSYWHSMTGMFP
jgi:GT2 family glycosyltransferase